MKLLGENHGLKILWERFKDDPKLGYSPITSVLVERFFSEFTEIATKKRNFKDNGLCDFILVRSNFIAYQVDERKQKVINT